MAKVQKITGSQTWCNYWTCLKQHQVAKFRARNQHATGISHSKTRHGSILLNTYDKSSLVTISQKKTRRYDGNHVNIASSVIRFQTYQKTEHGRNINMKASWWAWCTPHKAMHDKTSIPTARWHVYEAIHGKRKYIAWKDQLQQAWQNWISCKQSARNIL